MGIGPAFHPVATGQAARLLDSHKNTSNIVFWAGWFCPFTQRVWIVLEEKGIRYQYKEVNPYLKEKEFKDISPKGLVPAIQVDGDAVSDSAVINQFLEDAFPTPPLLPEDPHDRAIGSSWIDYINREVVPAFVRLLQAQKDEPEKQRAARHELKRALENISQHRRGKFFFGESFSLVDATIAPWIVRDFIAEDFRGFKREDVGNDWKGWADAIESRPSVVKTSSEKQRYLEFNGTFLRNESSSQVGIAARDRREID